MRKAATISSSLVFLLAAALPALSALAALAPRPGPEVPEPLRPWKGWALHGQEEKGCPVAWNNGQDHRCVWIAELSLTARRAGGRFEASAEVFDDTFAALPGGDRIWPQSVRVDGAAAPVTEKNGRPAVFLAKGAHRLVGEFSWERAPESLPIPSEAGIVRLSLDGVPVPFPDVREGRVWLDRARAGEEAAEERLELRVFRRIDDDIPLRVATRIELDVAGREREVSLGPVLPSSPAGTPFLPLRLSSPLPARVEGDGRLRLQVRPGRWTVEVEARSEGPVASLSAPALEAPWPPAEFWSFAARNQLRMVEPQGMDAVDPRQTGLPAEWQNLPAYRAAPGGTLSLVERRRGDPEPEPDQLTLSRTLWLDFDGRGYTARDVIGGTMSRSHRLEAGPGLLPGRVSVDGEDRLITRRPGTERPGVEVRRGRIAAEADSRIEGGVARIRATGWDHDVRSLTAELRLPPGWEAVAVTGADNRPDTWLQRWTLLDVFLTLVITVASLRLFGLGGGAVALAALALSWHAPWAPRYLWVHALAATALARYLPQGKFAKAARLYRGGALAALVLLFLPFAVQEVRTALYPQLDVPWSGFVSQGDYGQGYGAPGGAPPMPRAAAPEGMGIEEEMEAPAETLLESKSVPGKVMKRETAPSRLSSFGSTAYKARARDAVDAAARVQTGPGLPAWRWRTVQLSWSGPVKRDQELDIYYLSPAAHSAVKYLRVALVGLFLAVFFGLRPGRRRASGAAALALAVGLGTAVLPSPARAVDFPSDGLLNELRARLTEPAECLPNCAQANRLRLEAEGEELRLRAEISAGADVAVPLPADGAHWMPRSVTVDGAAARALQRAPDGTLWLRLTPGVHQVAMEGRLPPHALVQLPLAMPVRRVEAKVSGWRLEGVGENGAAEGQLQLARIEKKREEERGPAVEAGALPPFVTVERTLLFGLTWQARTRVIRASPIGTAVTVDVPLLDGESVVSADVPVEAGKAKATLGPAQWELEWLSTLSVREKVALKAPDTAAWTEVWRAEISPLWHLEQAGGLAVVGHRDEEGVWTPEWRPWPGEEIVLSLTRPEGVAGTTLTVDSSRFTVSPGARAADARLTVAARSSLGGRHAVTLPQGAELDSVKIDGRTIPLRPEGGKLDLPVVPGRQVYEIAWRSPEGVSSLYRPASPDLGIASVNQAVELKMPQDRWLLFAGGARLGPAVLFWGVLLVVVLAGLALGTAAPTPLKPWQWMLLGIGFTQSSTAGAALVAAWLIALGLRPKLPERMQPWLHNLAQIGLGLLTLAALTSLLDAVKEGLLGYPSMYVEGNGSTAERLLWYADRVDGPVTAVWAFSAPLWAYRLLMLAWALWLAVALISWIRWGWGNFCRGGYWKEMPLRWKKAGIADAAGETTPEEVYAKGSVRFDPDSGGTPRKEDNL